MRLYPSTKELVARRAHTPRLAPMSREGSVLMERDLQRFPAHNIRGEGAGTPSRPKWRARRGSLKTVDLLGADVCSRSAPYTNAFWTIAGNGVSRELPPPGSSREPTPSILGPGEAVKRGLDLSMKEVVEALEKIRVVLVRGEKGEPEPVLEWTSREGAQHFARLNMGRFIPDSG